MAPALRSSGIGSRLPISPALRDSGLLRRFLADRGNGYVWMTNLDNLGATVDPAMLGWMIENLSDDLSELLGRPARRGPHGARRLV